MKIYKFLVLFVFGLLSCLHASAQAVDVSEVPEAAVKAFQASHADLPSHVKPNWYKEKSMSDATKVLYKVSYMESTNFLTYSYNQNGGLVYQSTDWYQQNQAPKAAMDAIAARYPGMAMQRISLWQSDKYKLSGYVVRFSDKSRYFTTEGQDATGSPQTKILNAAFADPSNFEAAPATQSGKAKVVSQHLKSSSPANQE
jgi:hypothetical protein